MTSRTRFTAIPIDIAEDPVIPRLARKLGRSQNEALGLYVRAQGMGMKFSPDGDFSRFDAEDFAAGVGYDGDAGELHAAFVEGGAFVREGERLTLHRWSESGGRIVARLDSEAARKREKRLADKHSEAVESTLGGMSAGHPQDGRTTSAGRAHLDRDVDVDVDQDGEGSPEVNPTSPPPQDHSTRSGGTERGGEKGERRGVQGKGERVSTPEPSRTPRRSSPLPPSISAAEVIYRRMLEVQGMTPADVREVDRSRELNVAAILAGQKWNLGPEETAALTRHAIETYPSARPITMAFIRKLLPRWQLPGGGRSTLPASQIGAVSRP